MKTKGLRKSLNVQQDRLLRQNLAQEENSVFQSLVNRIQDDNRGRNVSKNPIAKKAGYPTPKNLKRGRVNTKKSKRGRNPIGQI